MRINFIVKILFFVSIFVATGINVSVADKNDKSPNILPNIKHELLIMFEGNEITKAKATIKDKLSGNFKTLLNFSSKKSKANQSQFVALFTSEKNLTNVDIESIESQRGVLFVERNFIYSTDGEAYDIAGLEDVNGSREYQWNKNSNNIEHRDEEDYRSANSNEPEAIVAVIDSGIDYNHPDFAERIWTNDTELKGLGGVDDDNNGYIDDIYGWNTVNNDGDPMDDFGHGTHVSGIILKDINSVENKDIKRTDKLMALKSTDESGKGTNAAAISAINYILNMKNAGENIKLVNVSLGSESYSNILKYAISELADAGILFIVSAGNNSSNNDKIPYYPASYELELDNVISVANSTKGGNLIYNSNFGFSIDLAAPGFKILSTYPVEMGSYQVLSGTSMAAPNVTGLMSYILQIHPELNYRDVKDIILTTVKKTDSLLFRTSTGGMLNQRKAIELDPNSIPSMITDVSITYLVNELELKIKGRRFGQFYGQIKIKETNHDRELLADIINWSDGEIVCRVPLETNTGLVTVQTDNGTSPSKLFTTPLHIRDLRISNFHESFAKVSGGSGRYKYSWDLNNDGTEDSNKEKPYIENDVSNRTVSVTVFDIMDVTNFVTASIQIPEKNWSISISNDWGYMSQTRVFSFNPPEGLKYYNISWDFDDDGEFDSNSPNPIYTFVEPGIHTVSVEAIDINDKNNIIHWKTDISIGTSNISQKTDSPKHYSESENGGCFIQNTHKDSDKLVEKNNLYILLIIFTILYAGLNITKFNSNEYNNIFIMNWVNICGKKSLNVVKIRSKDTSLKLIV